MYVFELFQQKNKITLIQLNMDVWLVLRAMYAHYMVNVHINIHVNHNNNNYPQLQFRIIKVQVSKTS